MSILATLAPMLISKGVGIIGNLLSNGVDEVANKTTDLIKEKTGIDLKKSTPTDEQIQQLKNFEIQESEKLREFQLEKLKIEQEKYKTAHDTYNKKSSMADEIAQSVIRWNLPIIAILVIANIYIRNVLLPM